MTGFVHENMRVSVRIRKDMRVPDSLAGEVRWNKVQKNAPGPWVCRGQARLRDNVIIQAMACQGDDGGGMTTDKILDRMSATVWEMAGR